jgi:hypothetical protein
VWRAQPELSNRSARRKTERSLALPASGS